MTNPPETPDAIDTLMEEHRRIERAIIALVAFAEHTEDAASDRPRLARFVTFLSRYADARHHHKEEEVLFKAMVDAGFPQRGGPIGMMLSEHDTGRAAVALLRSLSLGTAPWNAGDRALLREAANDYAALLFEHIRKEDGILYPMARQHLSPAALARVTKECRAIDAQWEANGELDSLLSLYQELTLLLAGEPAASPAL